MYNIDKTIKKLNTALVLLDAFGDGHEFTMHDYEELAASANELFGGRSGAIKTNKVHDLYSGNTYVTLDNKDTRNTLKEFFDRLIKAKVFEVDTMVFKSNGTNVLYVYKAR